MGYQQCQAHVLFGHWAENQCQQDRQKSDGRYQGDRGTTVAPTADREYTRKNRAGVIQSDLSPVEIGCCRVSNFEFLVIVLSQLLNRQGHPATDQQIEPRFNTTGSDDDALVFEGSVMNNIACCQGCRAEHLFFSVVAAVALRLPGFGPGEIIEGEFPLVFIA